MLPLLLSLPLLLLVLALRACYKLGLQDAEEEAQERHHYRSIRAALQYQAGYRAGLEAGRRQDRTRRDAKGRFIKR